MSLTYIAEIRLKPDCFAEACSAVDAIVPATRSEAGCEQFLPHRASDGTPTIYIYERWQDRAAFDFHHAQSYTREVFRNYENWLAEPVRLTELADQLV